MVIAFKAIGIPYLERASNLEGAYELLTSPGRTAWLHSPVHAAQAKRIVGLAKILGRTDELAVQIDENFQLLEGMKDFGLQDLQRFVAGIGVRV